MKRLTFSLALFVGLASFAAAGGGVSQEGPATLAEARALAAERSVPVLLDFYTDW